MTALLTAARNAFHRELIDSGALSFDRGIASNADRSQKSSVAYAAHIAHRLGVTSDSPKLAGQTSGARFEIAVQHFLNQVFPHFRNLRPGSWHIHNFGSTRRGDELARFEPYTHLVALSEAIAQNPTLQAVLGNAYTISPDVVITRQPVPDADINADDFLVDLDSGRLSPIRSSNNELEIVHAVISCKWTLRSDRAQNARSEALNLIRNRKGRLPHIAVVTGEPSPSRLSSLALGTGDIDCVYHFALPELQAAVADSNNDEAITLLANMVYGKRLKDITDLPLDLAI